MNAAEDFLEVVITSYILVSVMTYLGMGSLDDMPSLSLVSHDSWMEGDVDREQNSVGYFKGNC